MTHVSVMLHVILQTLFWSMFKPWPWRSAPSRNAFAANAHTGFTLPLGFIWDLTRDMSRHGYNIEGTGAKQDFSSHCTCDCRTLAGDRGSATHLRHDALHCVRKAGCLCVYVCSGLDPGSATAVKAGIMASKDFSDVSCILTWLGTPLRSCGNDMKMVAKCPDAVLCQPGTIARSGC